MICSLLSHKNSPEVEQTLTIHQPTLFIQHLSSTNNIPVMDLEREDTTQQSDMQPNQRTPTASQTAFAIPELAENVLNRLPDLRDLVHVRATSKILKTVVDQTPSIRRRLWNLPTPIKHGENPHFPNLSQTLFEYGIEGSMVSVLETFHDIEWDYYDAIEAGEDPNIALTAQ
jgi:hypothetical protein